MSTSYAKLTIWIDELVQGIPEPIMAKIKLVGKGLIWVLFLNMAVVYIWTVTLMPNGQSSASPLQASLRGAVQPAKEDFTSPDSFPEMMGLQHMIVVAGHAVTVRESLEGVEKDDEIWYLLPYQLNQVFSPSCAIKDHAIYSSLLQGLPEAFVAHIKAGVEAAAKDPSAVLVFSGGQTRGDAGPRSEAVSYFRVAEHFKWWDFADQVKNRTIAEEHARDSFENLLFSVCRFKEFTGHYPADITVISFNFKKERFESFHRAALRYPQANFHYIGMDPQGEQFDFEAANIGEFENALKLFRSDPYGCHSPGLEKKRLDRNPFRRTTPYAVACPEIRGLLKHCARSIYAEPLPWDAH